VIDHDLHRGVVILRSVVVNADANVPAVNDSGGIAAQSPGVEPLVPLALLQLLGYKPDLLNVPLQATLLIRLMGCPPVCVLGARSIKRDAQRTTYRLLSFQALPSGPTRIVPLCEAEGTRWRTLAVLLVVGQRREAPR
jgi:hypothetical protein